MKAIASLLALGLATAAPAAPRLAPEAELAQALEGRTAGRPVECINLPDVAGAWIVDRTAILYRVGGTIYVNRPRAGARSLDRFDVLSARAFAGRLCRGEPVNRLDSATGGQRGFVLLGDFVPYRRLPAR